MLVEALRRGLGVPDVAQHEVGRLVAQLALARVPAADGVHEPEVHPGLQPAEGAGLGRALAGEAGGVGEGAARLGAAVALGHGAAQRGLQPGLHVGAEGRPARAHGAEAAHVVLAGGERGRDQRQQPRRRERQVDLVLVDDTQPGVLVAAGAEEDAGGAHERALEHHEGAGDPGQRRRHEEPLSSQHGPRPRVEGVDEQRVVAGHDGLGLARGPGREEDVGGVLLGVADGRRHVVCPVAHLGHGGPLEQQLLGGDGPGCHHLVLVPVLGDQDDVAQSRLLLALAQRLSRGRHPGGRVRVGEEPARRHQHQGLQQLLCVAGRHDGRHGAAVEHGAQHDGEELVAVAAAHRHRVADGEPQRPPALRGPHAPVQQPAEAHRAARLRVHLGGRRAVAQRGKVAQVLEGELGQRLAGVLHPGAAVVHPNPRRLHFAGDGCRLSSTPARSACSEHRVALAPGSQHAAHRRPQLRCVWCGVVRIRCLLPPTHTHTHTRAPRLLRAADLSRVGLGDGNAHCLVRPGGSGARGPQPQDERTRLTRCAVPQGPQGP